MTIEKKSISLRVDWEFYEKYLLKIKNVEGCSITYASKILRKILDDAGGLKDYD